MIDGDPATRWCAASGQAGQTLTIDFGRPVAAKAMTVLWEKPGGLDLTVSDETGRLVPRSDPELHFTVRGDAEILAAGNGDATSHVTMHRADEMPAYNGLCQVILRRTGDGAITLKAEADGLASAKWRQPGR